MGLPFLPFTSRIVMETSSRRQHRRPAGKKQKVSKHRFHHSSMIQVGLFTHSKLRKVGDSIQTRE